ncbi:MAG TPA: hypothetical protein ENI74_03595 [Gammaproteobacteria bacterium]|nr:hypothetical protein [Gammaproteobacteria bacterium]
MFVSSGPLEKQVIVDPGAIAISGISSARKRDVKILDLSYLDKPLKGKVTRRGLYKLVRSDGVIDDPTTPILSLRCASSSHRNISI